MFSDKNILTDFIRKNYIFDERQMEDNKEKHNNNTDEKLTKNTQHIESYYNK